MADKYAGLNTHNCDVVVEHNNDMQTFPYTIKKMNAWGLSDGTLSETNPLAGDSDYELVMQVEQANIYIKK